MGTPIKQVSITRSHSELRAVIFDYGGVLSLLPTEQDWEQLAHAAKISRSILDSCYWKFREEYDRAIYNGIAYWRRIAGAGGRALTEEEATRLVALDNYQWARENPLTVELVSQLRGAGIKTAVLSNMQFEMLSRIRAMFPWLRQFDFQLYSCELGISKPDPEIFLHAAGLLKVPPQQALFLDDRQENLDGAAQVGMETMKYKAPYSHEELQQLLASSGVDVCGPVDSKPAKNACGRVGSTKNRRLQN